MNLEQHIAADDRHGHDTVRSQRSGQSEMTRAFDADNASRMLGEIIRTFPMGATSSTTPSSEVQMERGLVLAQELVERLSHVRPNEHSVSSHRIRFVRAHALAIVDLLEEAVLGGL